MRLEDYEVENAAKLSGADNVAASLPDGYKTFLGKEFDNGYDLSQGQWQKIAIARAYLRDAEVMVLDEPTASLDPKAEVEIYKQFCRFGNDTFQYTFGKNMLQNG
jgi:ATP-binding cassette, subfamily B, bacterial